MSASNDSRAMLEAFYSKILSAGGSANVMADGEKFLAPTWTSVGNYTGQNKDRAAFLKQMTGFTQLIPDLKWKIEEVISSGDRHVVRSRATGTPRGPLFGVGPNGKPFDIMTIDIHTVRDGQVATTYHVEDWSTALAQVR
jgi:predicted ester cyclase